MVSLTKLRKVPSKKLHTNTTTNTHTQTHPHTHTCSSAVVWSLTPPFPSIRLGHFPALSRLLASSKMMSKSWSSLSICPQSKQGLNLPAAHRSTNRYIKVCDFSLEKTQPQRLLPHGSAEPENHCHIAASVQAKRFNKRTTEGVGRQFPDPQGQFSGSARRFERMRINQRVSYCGLAIKSLNFQYEVQQALGLIIEGGHARENSGGVANLACLFISHSTLSKCCPSPNLEHKRMVLGG